MGRYSDNEALRIGEEYCQTLRELIENEQHNLDLFNLEVAKFRLKYGMSLSLAHLYGRMGKLSKNLMSLEPKIVEIGSRWKEIVGYFQHLEDAKEGNE